MSDRTERLQHLLAEEVEHFGRFCLLLREEREALASQDGATLERVVGDKEKICRALGELARRRQEALGTTAPDAVRPRLEAYSPALAVSWDRLLELAREAQELNQVNGRIIELQLHQNRQAFNLLKGAQGASALYTAAGQPESAPNARDLGSA